MKNKIIFLLRNSVSLDQNELVPEQLTQPVIDPPTPYSYSFEKGMKQYEFSNHLGNVLSTFTDRKLPQDEFSYNPQPNGDYEYHPDGNFYYYVGAGNGNFIQSPYSDGFIDYYTAQITSATDYYPFGMAMSDRNFVGEYRYGFNSMEKDDELKGTGKSYDFGARLYDPRVGRWLAVDALGFLYAAESNYSFAGNQPINMRDLEGYIKFEDEKQFKKEFPRLYEYIVKNLVTDVMNHESLKQQMMHIGYFSEADLQKALKYGNDQGPIIRSGNNTYGRGEYDPQNKTISLQKDFLKELENAPIEEIQEKLLRITGVILHEMMHHGRSEYILSNPPEIPEDVSWYEFAAMIYCLYEIDICNKYVYSESNKQNIQSTEPGYVLEFNQWGRAIADNPNAAKEVISENELESKGYFVPTAP